ncbi:TetR/AcrR family transcriptional regulator [Nocardia alni]|uniref:TetR/AcrR family transcriptional regulator n=1 Tax=Nocardia alni TaxID=2815723 RepID=UPI001C235EA0|nr:TetR/AcrR family transcriptional regulator [Nocardia alni]
MTDRAYHHGDLRAALLAEAERTLREQGIDHLSLRDLARQVGVSHAAPRRHFADRKALLDALAEAGFARLGDSVRAAIDGSEDYREQLLGAGRAFVEFAANDANLFELMFAAKLDEPSPALEKASTRLFAAYGALIEEGQRADVLPPGDPWRLQLLLAATMQGIAVLVTSGRAPGEMIDPLVTDAVALFTRAGS